MFLDHVYHVASSEATAIPLKGKMVKVSDPLRRECRLIRFLHILSIGVFTMLGSSLSSLFGNASFFKGYFIYYFPIGFIDVYLQ